MALGIGLHVMIGCTHAAPEPAADPTPAATPAAAAPATAIHRTDDGRCTPMPKVGDTCQAGDGWCVESWGEPGGHSSALWCRGGTWQREEEVNLPQ
jgi:hypothetical protein